MNEILLGIGGGSTGEYEHPYGDQFLGEVPASEFIAGSALASAIGLTVGTAQHSNEPWLKFLTGEGQTLYVAKKPFRYGISWNTINSCGAVFGETELIIHDNTYKVRLLKGSSSDPVEGTNGWDAEHTWGSEWNRLMYPLTATEGHTKSNVSTFPYSGEGLLFGGWVDYHDDQDLGITSQAGSYNWCQETQNSRRLVRGCNGITRALNYDPRTGVSDLQNTFGWRPVLELVE